MRKLIAIALLVAAGNSGFAQDYKEVKDKLATKNYTEARTAIDKLSSNTKATGTSDYWFYRGQVFSGLAETDTAATREAISALNRYYEMEAKKPQETRHVLAVMFDNNHKTSLDLYNNNFNAGVKSFQAQKWADAQASFGRALAAFSLLSNNSIISQKFDTTTTLYAGYAAQNAKDLATAAYYYGRLVDQNITDTTMVGAYEFLVTYYQQNKDEANFKKYLGISKQRFPQYAGNWTRIELSTLENDPAKKLTRLAELAKADPKNQEVATDYTVELFNYTYSKDKPSDYTARQNELEEALRALTVNFPEVVYGNYVLTQHLSNEIYDLQQSRNAIKGAKPEDIKKKQEIDKQIMAKFDALYPYGTKAISLYEGMGADIKQTDKYNYKNVLNTMASYYDAKKQPAKAKELEDKAKAIK